MKKLEEKRVTLRFRLDKSRDRQAYDTLVKLSEAQNSSLNETILELLTRADKRPSGDNFSMNDIKQLASLIAEQIKTELPAAYVQNAEIDHSTSKDNAEESMDILDENAFSFLDSFGIE